MKVKQLVAIIFCVIALAACTSKEAVKTEAEEQNQNQSEEEGMKLKKGLMNVELTLPAQYFEEEELEELKKDIKQEHNADITQNEDGTFSIKMSTKDHEKMLQEMEDSMKITIGDIIEDKELASIQDITYNKNFTSFNVVVKRDEFENSFDGFATLTLGLTGLYYQAFSGKDITQEKITIHLQDLDTGEVYEEIVYPDALDEMADE